MHIHKDSNHNLENSEVNDWAKISQKIYVKLLIYKAYPQESEITLH